MATRPPKKKKTVKKNSSSPKTRWGILALMAIVAIGMIWAVVPKGNSVPKVKTNNRKEMGPPFTKEGELQLFKADSSLITQLDIELALNSDEQAQGLMWRRQMNEDQGMLFIMDQLEPQSFWMRNTYISLDIIYLDDQQRIVSIAKNTQPESLKPVPSEGPAKFVLEVIAGFSDKYGLAKGDYMEFTKM